MLRGYKVHIEHLRLVLILDSRREPLVPRALRQRRHLQRKGFFIERWRLVLLCLSCIIAIVSSLLIFIHLFLLLIISLQYYI